MAIYIYKYINIYIHISQKASKRISRQYTSCEVILTGETGSDFMSIFGC